MQQIRVLMVVPNLRVANGVASFAMNYYRKLDHQKINMDFAAYRMIESPYMDEISRNGDNVFFISPMRHVIKHFLDCKQLLDNKYDILHNNSLLITFPLMLLAKKRIPYRILHSHSTRLGETDKSEKRNKVFMPLFKSLANKYAACSSDAGRALFSSTSFEIIPDVIDVQKYSFDIIKREQIRQKECVEGKVVVGTVGRITDAKNPFFAMDVIEQVMTVNPLVEYWWIGSGALDEEVAAYIKSKKLESRIKLFGSMNDVADYYQAMDVFFMPSKCEGFGLACVEAEAAGLKCIVSDNLPKEVDVTGNVTFIPVTSKVEEWVDVIIDAISVQRDRKFMCEDVQNSICSDMTAGQRLLKYYSDIMQGK